MSCFVVRLFVIFHAQETPSSQAYPNSSRARRYPKSGAFRRKASATEWMVVCGLLAHLKAPRNTSPPQTPLKPSRHDHDRESPHSSVDSGSHDVELDSEGYPLVFQSKCGMVREDSMASIASVASIVSAASIASGFSGVGSIATVDSQRTVGYDVDGWPDIFQTSGEPNEGASAGGKLVATRVADAGNEVATTVATDTATTNARNADNLPSCSKKPIQPRGAARKTAALATRAQLAARETSKSKRQGLPADRTQKQKPCKNACSDVPLMKARVSGPTQEDNPRVEVTATAVLEGAPRRVHVFTLTRRGFGAKHNAFANKVASRIDKENITKGEALRMRDAALS